MSILYYINYIQNKNYWRLHKSNYILFCTLFEQFLYNVSLLVYLSDQNIMIAITVKIWIKLIAAFLLLFNFIKHLFQLKKYNKLEHLQIKYSLWSNVLNILPSLSRQPPFFLLSAQLHHNLEFISFTKKEMFYNVCVYVCAYVNLYSDVHGILMRMSEFLELEG